MILDEEGPQTLSDQASHKAKSDEWKGSRCAVRACVRACVWKYIVREHKGGKGGEGGN